MEQMCEENELLLLADDAKRKESLQKKYLQEYSAVSDKKWLQIPANTIMIISIEATT